MAEQTRLGTSPFTYADKLLNQLSNYLSKDIGSKFHSFVFIFLIKRFFNKSLFIYFIVILTFILSECSRTSLPRSATERDGYLRC